MPTYHSIIPMHYKLRTPNTVPLNLLLTSLGLSLVLLSVVFGGAIYKCK